MNFTLLNNEIVKLNLFLKTIMFYKILLKNMFKNLKCLTNKGKQSSPYEYICNRNYLFILRLFSSKFQ